MTTHMNVFLVRHADAKSRSHWSEPDALRPLTKRGQRQAEGLIASIGSPALERLFSSPAVRCHDTLAPLATDLGLPVKTDDSLAEGASAKRALTLIESLCLETGDTVLCTHGDLIPEVLRLLAKRRVEIPDDFQCAKGSTWVLHAEAGAITSASYLPPPG